MEYVNEPNGAAATLPTRGSRVVMSHLPSAKARHNVGGATLARRRLAEERHQRTLSHPNTNDYIYMTIDAPQVQENAPASDSGLLESRSNFASLPAPTNFDYDDLSLDSLRELCCSMQKKKEIRAKLLADHGRSGAKIKLSSQSSLNWRKFKDDFRDVLHELKFWQSAIHEVEGRFGTGIRSYFTFLRRLFILNLCIFLLTFLFIVLPTIIFDNTIEGITYNNSVLEKCVYAPYDPNSITYYPQYIIWWFTGQGFMEDTLLFSGYYDNVITNATAVFGFPFYYNLPLAYLLVAFFYFLLSLVLIVQRAAKGFQRSLITDSQLYSYCNLVFGSWDYCIADDKAASLKQSSLKYELRTDLEEARIRKRQQDRKRNEKIVLYMKRIAFNLIVFLIVGLSLTAIYFAALYSLNKTSNPDDGTNFFLDLIITYLTSIVITIVNFIAPFVFEFIVQYEDYSPEFAIRFTLIRIVLLRLLSLIALYVFVFFQINCCPPLSFNYITGGVCDVDCQFCQGIKCWETYVGQEMYKLALLDFFAVVGMTLLIEFPRKLIVDRCDCGLSKWLGQQEFSIPTNVLDIVYAQTIGWIGAFFAPLLPVLMVIKFFVYFYVKKLTLIYNCRPSTRPYRASKFGSFFFIMLILGLSVALVPVIVSVSVMKPSRDCGPFRGWNSMFDAITLSIDTNLNSALWWKNLLWFLGSSAFAVIIIIFLCLMLYYYIALGTAHDEMIDLLRNQLKMEGKDKQFLLKRFNYLSEELQLHDLQSAQQMRKFTALTGQANPAFSGDSGFSVLPGQIGSVSD